MIKYLFIVNPIRILKFAGYENISISLAEISNYAIPSIIHSSIVLLDINSPKVKQFIVYALSDKKVYDRYFNLNL
jgi:hypothetical protein